jgi:hypothetical protein
MSSHEMFPSSGNANDGSEIIGNRNKEEAKRLHETRISDPGQALVDARAENYVRDLIKDNETLFRGAGVLDAMLDYQKEAGEHHYLPGVVFGVEERRDDKELKRIMSEFSTEAIASFSVQAQLIEQRLVNILTEDYGLPDLSVECIRAKIQALESSESPQHLIHRGHSIDRSGYLERLYQYARIAPDVDRWAHPAEDPRNEARARCEMALDFKAKGVFYDPNAFAATYLAGHPVLADDRGARMGQDQHWFRRNE